MAGGIFFQKPIFWAGNSRINARAIPRIAEYYFNIVIIIILFPPFSATCHRKSCFWPQKAPSRVFPSPAQNSGTSGDTIRYTPKGVVSFISSSLALSNNTFVSFVSYRIVCIVYFDDLLIIIEAAVAASTTSHPLSCACIISASSRLYINFPFDPG